MQLFYAPQFSESQPFLPEEEARHALKVLRLKTGDSLHLTDGQGNLYQTSIVNDDPKKCLLKILKTEPGYGKRSYSIHIAVAPTKNADRTEWLVEKCVEIGVDEISFIACERSERKFFKLDRVEKIAVAAMKQSIKAYLPRLHEIVSLKDFLKKANNASKFIAHLAEGERKLLQQSAQPAEKYSVLIGPEGDFTAAEVQLARQNGYSPVSLGESRLRTETAGIVACHTLHLVNVKR